MHACAHIYVCYVYTETPIKAHTVLKPRFLRGTTGVTVYFKIKFKAANITATQLVQISAGYISSKNLIYFHTNFNITESLKTIF